MPVAKKTSKNQLTLPKAIVDRFPGVSYFDVREEDGRIVLSRGIRTGSGLQGSHLSLPRLGLRRIKAHLDQLRSVRTQP